MDFVFLKDVDVKDTISKNKIEHREFFVNKYVYAIVKDNEVLAMAGVSDNKQLYGAVKIYNPFFVSVDVGTELINQIIAMVKKNNKNVIIYTDCLEDTKKAFTDAGFIITSTRNRLKRYVKLYRGVYNG